MSPILQVHNLRVHFGGVRAVEEVSLSLDVGGFYGLVGPNGSGKSTLLGAMSRMTHISDGTLSYDGQGYTRMSPAAVARMGIRRTFQTVRLLPALNVLENVMLGADSRFAGTGVIGQWLLPWRTKRAEQTAREAALASLDKLGLTDDAARYPSELPYGTQRRVEIARGLVASPRIILFDEPAAGMNRQERDEIGSVMRTLQLDGITQVLVEHNVQMITELCDHVFVMNTGRLIAEGTPQGIVLMPAVQEAYLGKRAAHVTS